MTDAEIIEEQRAEISNLERILRNMVRGWKYADLSEAEFIEAWDAIGGIDAEWELKR